MSAGRLGEVVVVGGGISGLSAAFELVRSGESAPGHVTVIEAAERVGGKLAPTALGDRVVDAAPDGVLARRPELAQLLEELGAAEGIVPIAASGASVFARGAVRPLPKDLSLGVPTSWSSLRRSGLLSTRGLLAALRDVVSPRPASRGHLSDRAIGGLVETKLGPEVVATLVDPMLGGICAGRVSELSAAAVFPPLLEAAQQRGSLMAAMREAVPSPGPAVADEGGEDAPPPPAAFITYAGGMHAVPGLLREALEAAGVTIVTGRSVTGLRWEAGRWWVDTDSTTTPADGVVLALPATAAADLISPLDADAASLLAQTAYASVAVLTFELAEGAIELPETGTGLLVPPGTPVPSGDREGERFLTTALTFLDRKWPQLHREGTILLRASVGRIDDERPSEMTDAELTSAVLDELDVLFGLEAKPTRSSVARWERSLPQYKVNHLLRTAGIDAAVRELAGLELCGAAYGGIGVPACIASGRAAARRLLEEAPAR